MTVVTLRPNSTTSNTGTVAGAASAHAALSDNSDASAVGYTTGQRSMVGLGDLSLPAGAVIKTVTIRARTDRGVDSATKQLAAGVGVVSGTTLASGTTFVSWASPTTTTVVANSQAGFTDADVDAAILDLLDANGLGLTIYEAYVDVTYVTQPSVAVNAPTGTVTDTNQPTVTWTVTIDSDGGTQVYREVKIFTDAQYTAGGFDPATSTQTAGIAGEGASPATSGTVDQVLPDDTYRAYVRVAQVVNGNPHWSDWAYTEFTIDVDLPGTPTFTATADNTNARITLAITDNADPVTSTDRFELERSLDAGSTWEPVRTLDGDGLLEVPYVAATSTYADTADATSHAVPYPAPPGGILTDDLLVSFSAFDDGVGVTYPAGWIELQDGLGGGSAVTVGAAWMRAVGGESGTFTIATSAGIPTGGGARVLCIRGAHAVTPPEDSGGVAASAANANPDALNPSAWGTENTLWIAAVGNDGNVAVTAGPTGYSRFGNTRWANANGAGISTAVRLALGASEDPGTFTHTTEDTRAFTVAVRPRNPDLTVWDYEAPNGLTTHYRARSLHDYNGIWAASPWVTDTEAWTSASWWLKHPNLPELNMPVQVRSFPTVQRAGRQGIFQALGATNPIVVSDTRESAKGAVTLRLDTTGTQDDLDALLNTVGTLLLQSPVGGGGPDYIRVVNHQRQRAIDWENSTPSFDTLEFVVVDRLSGTVALFPSDSLFPS